MTDNTDIDERYWLLVQEFVELANSKLEHDDLGVVSEALMEASARFSSFYAASSSEGRKDLKEDKESTVQDFGGEFKRRLAHSLDDYIENYKVYMREGVEQ